MKIKPLVYDTIFKAVFIEEKEVLLKIVKDILDIKEDVSIERVEVMPGYELEPLSKNNKTYKTDVLIKLNDNSYVNIEINKRNNKDILSRNVLQVSRIYSKIVEKGANSNELSSKVVKQLNLNTFSTYSGKPMEKILLCETETKKPISDKFSIYTG